MSNINIDDTIKSASKILITSHINPDGDTLGSMCALYNGIKENFKKQADMFIASKVPYTYRDLPFVNLSKREFDKSLVYDVVISVDVAAKDRMGEAVELFDKARCRINIDHHKTNHGYGDINIIDSAASSAGMILFKYFREHNWNISKDTAECLYISILTDTGGFKYENTTAETLKIAGELITLGVNPNKIYKSIYETKTKDNVMFQAGAVSRAKFCNNDKIAYITIYKKDLEGYQSTEDFTEGLVEKLRTIDSVDAAFLVKEIDSKNSKVSMRSKELDVAEICAQFGGGGHTYAAGCVIKSSVNTSVKKILNLIKERV